MGRKLLTYLLVGVSIYILTALTGQKTNMVGEWRIYTVIVDGDTLYHDATPQFTMDFYNTQMNGWEKSEDDTNYIAKCSFSTYIEFKQARLKLTRKNYSQTAITPCWDNIKFVGVFDEKYNLDGDSIQLLNSNESVLMEMNYIKSSDHLFYSNSDHNYQIIYTRINGK